jgi:hypothetical protein
LHVLPLETVAIRLPWRCGATAVALGNDTVVKKSHGVPSNPTVTWVPGEGVVVEFDLPGPDPGASLLPRVHGEIHLAWTMGGTCAQVTPPRPQVRSVGEKREKNSAERRLKALAAPSVAVALAAPVSKDDVASTPTLKEKLSPKERRTGSVRIQDAKLKLRRDESVLRARCQAEDEKRAGRAPPECDRVLGR